MPLHGFRLLLFTIAYLQVPCKTVSATNGNSNSRPLRRMHLSLERTSAKDGGGTGELEDRSEANLEEKFQHILLKGRTSRHSPDLARSGLDNLEAPHSEEEELETPLREEQRLYNNYELVVARYKEDVSWGGEDHPLPEIEGRQINVIELPNEDREGQVYYSHIADRYDSLADFTVFSQATPFQHSPHFLDLLGNPQLYQPVQCMTEVYASEGDPAHVTPKEVVQIYRKHEWYRSGTMSLRTLDSVYFSDAGAAQISRDYRNLHNLPPGTNIVAHFLSQIGLPGWIPNENLLGSFGYAGIHGVERSKILQHPRQIYENLIKILTVDPIHGYVLERTHLLLFGGPYVHD